MHVMYKEWKVVTCRDKMVVQWCSKGNPYGLRHCSLNRSKNLVAVSLDLERTRENNMALRRRRALAIERPGAIHRTSHLWNKPKRQTACFLLISFNYSSFLTSKFGEIFITKLFFIRFYQKKRSEKEEFKINEENKEDDSQGCFLECVIRWSDLMVKSCGLAISTL